MKVIDLFSGIGGLSQGFRNVGFDIVLANEIDGPIANSYQQNHPSTKMINADITQLDINNVFNSYKDVDVIIGGPPCQGFSQKGSRLILDDSRNFLFKYFFEVVSVLRPKYFVMENVPNLLTTSNGYFKEEIYRLFSDLGYSINSGVLNASNYGVPQDRRRAFIIGRLGSKKLAFPIAHNEKVSTWDAISDLAFLESGEGTFEQNYSYEISSDYQKRLRGQNKILYNHSVTKHSALAVERMNLVPENGGRSDLPKEHLTKSVYSGTWGRINKDLQSVTITTRFDTPSSGRFTHPFLNRAITVREAARLQSFSDDIIFYGNKTSQMKQVGNAVPPLLAEEIAKVIKSDMED